MNKWVLLFGLLGALLFGRDNPFKPVIDQESMPISTNIPQELKPFEHSKIRLPSSAREIKKITITYKNLDGSVDTVDTLLNHSVDWRQPITVNHTKTVPKNSRFTSIAKLPFIEFYQKDKQLKITTQNKMLRHFIIANPHRLVLDFSRTSHFLSKKFEINQTPFERIRLGNHKDYYRVVVELDGPYEYTLNQSKESIEIGVR